MVSSIAVAYTLLMQNQDASEHTLEGVHFWAYQLQGIDEDGAVDILVDSKYDLLVLEPTRSDRDSSDFDTAGMVSMLHASSSANFDSKLVIAYVDIGQAEDWRWYWNDSWIPPTETNRGEPDFLLSVDPDGWEGNYPVAFWYEDWKDIMLYDEGSSIQQILDDGFDGIYMDWIEAYDHGPVIDVAEEEEVDAHEEMVSFIEEIRQYCRLQNPDFLLIAQNALAISDGHPEYFDAIDGVAQEHIIFDGIADTSWGEPGSGDIRIPSADEEGYSTEWYTERLDAYLDEGKTVFVVDYATNEANIAESYSYANAHGYVGFVSQIALSQLPTTTPPSYPSTLELSAVQTLVNRNAFRSKSLKSGPNV
ncbi:MAG: endo alpha-1,4 polygalactosaminidase [Candidatus Thorarchaeota archaeon]